MIKGKIQAYRKGNQIGKGNYGVVYLSQAKGIKIAIKQIRYQNKKKDINQYINRQRGIMKRLNHESIVKVIQVIEQHNKVYIVMKYYQQNLKQYLTNRRQILSAAQILKIMEDLINGMLYLAQLGIVHRDIKLDNILVDQQGNCKIADFGLAEQLYDYQIQQMHKNCGTQLYKAPQINIQSYNSKVDIWSLGIVFYILVEGSFPKEYDLDKKCYRRKIKFSQQKDDDKLQLKKIILQMLQVSYLRPSWKQIIRKLKNTNIYKNQNRYKPTVRYSQASVQQKTTKKFQSTRLSKPIPRQLISKENIFNDENMIQDYNQTNKKSNKQKQLKDRINEKIQNKINNNFIQ